MGNQQCNQCKHTLLESNAYGVHELSQSKGNVVAVVEKMVERDDALKKIVEQELQTRIRINSPHIAKLYSYEIVEQDYGFKAVMQYEYIPKSLRERARELQDRAQDFNERQLFSIMYGIEEALREFAKHDIKHCCINLDTIMCKNNIYKITDMSSLTYVTSYDLACKGNREQFLSERLLAGTYSKSLNPTYYLKDDYFSLAMAVLSVAVARPPGCYYSWNEKGQGTLSIKNLEASLREVQKKYSSRLVKKIKYLLYYSQEEESTEESNLNENLMDLEQHMDRVMKKAQKASDTTATHNSTFSSTPARQTAKKQGISKTISQINAYNSISNT